VRAISRSLRLRRFRSTALRPCFGTTSATLERTAGEGDAKTSRCGVSLLFPRRNSCRIASPAVMRRVALQRARDRAGSGEPGSSSGVTLSRSARTASAARAAGAPPTPSVRHASACGRGTRACSCASGCAADTWACPCSHPPVCLLPSTAGKAIQTSGPRSSKDTENVCAKPPGTRFDLSTCDAHLCPPLSGRPSFIFG